MEQHTGQRRRPALSCIECRRRKIKCDRTKPCAHCRSANSQCLYKVFSNEPRLRKSHEQATTSVLISDSTTSTLSSESTHQQIHTARPVAQERDHNSPGSRSAVVTAIQRANVQGSNHGHAVETDLQNILCRLRKLEEASIDEPLCEAARPIQEILTFQSRGMHDMQSRTNKTRILRWSHWADEAPEVRKSSRTKTGLLI